VVDRSNSDDDARCPISAVNEEEVQHYGEDHQEDCVSGATESNCGGGRCGDNGGDCESVFDKRKGSRCGNEGDHSVAEEFACDDDPRGTDRITSTFGGTLRLTRDTR